MIVELRKPDKTRLSKSAARLRFPYPISTVSDAVKSFFISVKKYVKRSARAPTPKKDLKRNCRRASALKGGNTDFWLGINFNGITSKNIGQFACVIEFNVEAK